MNIGITEKNTGEVAKVLSKILADETVLYIKTKNAHWNIEGPDFYSMHTFFEKQFGQLDVFMNDVAERIRSVGHYVPSTLNSYLSLTHFTEETREVNNCHGFINSLLTDHERLIIVLRENINRFATEFHDLGSSDFITRLMEKHEKMAWYLRSHLENGIKI